MKLTRIQRNDSPSTTAIPILMWAGALFLIGIPLLAYPTPTSAQGNAGVINMASGLQFEGELSGVPAIIEGSGVFETYGTQPIVRIDDGMRRVYVSFNRVVPPIGDSNRNEIEIPVFQRAYPGSVGQGSILFAGPFNEWGHRELVVQIPGRPNPVTYVQGITKITPRYCELKTLVGTDNGPKKQWAMKIGISQVPSAVLRKVLRSQIRDIDNPTEYLKIADFFLQARQYENALTELRFIQQRFPDLKDQIKNDRILIRQSYAQQILREIHLRLDTGQLQLATAFAKVFNKEDLLGETLAEFDDIEQTVIRNQKEVDQTRKAITELLASIKSAKPTESEAIKRLKNELETELNIANRSRLDAFLRMANDVSMPAKQKLSLAISGWLLGSNHAIENLAISGEMFTVRDLVKEYLTTTNPQRRTQILTELEKFEAGVPEYLTPMIQQMKPINGDVTEGYTGEKPIHLQVKIPGPKIDPKPLTYDCLVHLPPGYDPHRRYPLLLALPGGRQTAEQHLNMWAGTYSRDLGVRTGHSMRHGYVTMVVDWRAPGQSSYGYSAREHAAVLAALRAALRSFSIDSDRVFLSGHGIGGDAAYDIGISHPEHWAGVIGVSGKMDRYVDIYASNLHVPLAVYSVVGTKDIPTIIENKNVWNKWLPSKRYADCTVVMYEGRANELFPEEIPEIFKWMQAQRRRWPDKTGFHFECRALRPWDTYFWFYEFHGLPPANVVWPQLWRENKFPHILKISGETKITNPNFFKLGPAAASVKIDSTLWLSPEFIDYQKPVEIKGRGKFKGFVKPSTQVLLEDVRRRADRNHPYWSRIDCRNMQWQANP